MMFASLFRGFFVLQCVIPYALGAYQVVIKSTAPAVLGARVNLTATLYEDGYIAPEHQYRFIWSDDAQPQHLQTEESAGPVSNFSLSYDKKVYKPRKYNVSLNILRSFVGIYFPIIESTTSIDITEMFSGNMSLTQDGKERLKDNVALGVPVNHSISLRPGDAEFIRNATNITTYWILNCKYLGASHGLSIVHKYDKNESYDIEALVEVSFEKIEPITTTPAPTTTTSTTTPKVTTTSVPITTTSTTPTPLPTKPVTTSKPNISSSSSESSKNSRRKREAKEATTEKAEEKTTIKYKPIEKEISASGEEIEVNQIPKSTAGPIISETTTSGSIDDNFRNHPDSCLNFSQIDPDPKKTYGYFKRRFMAKEPVANMTISGNRWLQHGELFHLDIKCTGAMPLGYCIKIFEGAYNTTGEETCADLLSLDSCQFSFTHLFYNSNLKSIVIIVQNDVNKVVNQVAVNFYQATKQSQLSVIVVPVAFSLVAVILVVFGVAYYIQNKSRYIVEVADFNFGDSQSVDMEYKTFQARLWDSVREVIPWPRRHESDETEDSHSAEDSSIKYGSMT